MTMNSHSSDLISQIFNEPNYNPLLNEQGFPDLIIVAYQENSFYYSREILLTDYKKRAYYALEQEVIDKTNVKDVVDCQDDPNYNEDQCLNSCLINKFVEKFNCVHARLRLLDAPDLLNVLQHDKSCQYLDLK